jgi:hypothetical protein
MSEDAIFNETLHSLSWHQHREWGNATPIDVFNRLLAKNIRPEGWTVHTHLSVQSHQVRSRREGWTTDALSKLQCGHGSAKGGNFDSPIVVAEFEDTQRVLDGI